MQAILQKDLRYQQYLENVLDSTDEYPEIVELLLRYETLEATHQDLVERSREGQAVSEDQSALNKRCAPLAPRRAGAPGHGLGRGAWGERAHAACRA